VTTAVPRAGEELLDDLAAPPAAVRTTLRNIARSNWWFGGTAAVRFGVARLLGDTRPALLSVLDVGTGQGDVPQALARWLTPLGTSVAPIGIERHPVAARAAADGGLPTILGDGCRLPLRDRSVDVVVISQVAHHFDAAGMLVLVGEASRVARRGVVISDLRRSPLAAWGFQLAGRVLRFDRWTRTDGARSIARGFTAAALSRQLRAAGHDASVVDRPIARIVAHWRTDR
jgi:SAM-dependent methyltransferase